MTRPLALIGAVLLLAASGVWAHTRLNDGFPHEQHLGVFPLCSGCHAGIASGARAAWYPDSSSCVNCHDGITEARVEWSGPGRAPSNLRFDHPTHATRAAAAGDSLTCNGCHQQEGRTERMAVGRARPETCVTCHAHDAPEHLALNADCQVCHLPIVLAADLSPDRIGAFPQPSTHEANAFLELHGRDLTVDDQTCSVCHARESCERCHLNAGAIATITALEADARIATLTMTEPAEYPTPSSHERGEWLWRHADDADTRTAGCANCHAQPSCQECHQGAELRQIEALPVPRPDGPQGVVFTDAAPVVHPSGFSSMHGAQAAASGESCSSCHAEQDLCLDCHEGPSSPGFHVGNFRERHGALAYGGEAECASCHNTEVFCRSCHAGNGLASGGNRAVAFHTAQPFWLLGHGQAARRDLQSCATCHAQTDCTQCHSSLGAWRINPHGPGFDASRYQDANRITCLACHRGDPINRE